MTKIRLLTKIINGVEFEVDTAVDFEVSALRINGDAFFVQDVDLAQILRAVHSSDDLHDLKNGVKGVWREKELQSLINRMMV